MARPDGLLAWGGDVHPDRLIEAYRNGIFPWYDEDSPILWWSPEPRGVLRPERIQFSKSLAVSIRKQGFEVRADTAFEEVMAHCRADRRTGPSGSWINDDIVAAFVELHQRGIAHSLEVYRSGGLVGGLYGLWMNGVFCGESMFSVVPDASKTALVGLAGWMRTEGHPLIDTQLLNPHLESMGAEPLPREDFERYLPEPQTALCLIDFRAVDWNAFLRRTPEN